MEREYKWQRKKQEKNLFRNRSLGTRKNIKQIKQKLRNITLSGKKKAEKKIVVKSEKSLCPVHGKCGGCQLLDMPYEKQLKQKQKQVNKLLKPYCNTEKIIGMENPFHYRNKVHAVFGHRKDGTVISGIYQQGTHFIVPVDECLIEDKRADAIIRDIRDLLKSFKIKTYNEDTGYGLFRHVLVRTGHHSGQVMVVLVLGSPILPSKNNFVKALRKLHPEITTIILNVNNQKTSMILGEKETVLYGKGYIEDELCGHIFRISSKSFYQVNTVQTEKLYTKAIELAGLTGKERVIDAYCGIGTISLFLAQKAKFVRGVEIVPAAIEDAKRNAQINHIENVEFFVGKAEEVLPREYEKNGVYADVIVVDPPRKGCDEMLLKTILKMQPKRVVYVSCDSATLARDLRFLCDNGYELKKVCGVDQFPQTVHVESIVLLSHKSPDSHIDVKVEFGEGEEKVPLDKIAERAKQYQPAPRVTYKMIQEYIEEKYGFKVHTAYIAEVKRNLGLPMYDAPNMVEELKQPRRHPTAEKVEAIKDALKPFWGDLI